MEQTVTSRPGRRSGWSEQETQLLWETADEAQLEGIPLKQVFERLASTTGRRPNSIRNYYYAQVRQREGERSRAARFVPFTEPEIEELMETVLRARSQGQSVRSCLQQMSNGNHSLMLRYQNKYRSVLKNRPDLVAAIVKRLQEQGVDCQTPEVHSRSRYSLEESTQRLNAAALEAGGEELARACEVFTSFLRNGRASDRQTQLDRLNVRLDLYRLALSEQEQASRLLVEAANELTAVIKDFAILPEEARQSQIGSFVERLTERIGALEGRITEAEAKCEE